MIRQSLLAFLAPPRLHGLFHPRPTGQESAYSGD